MKMRAGAAVAAAGAVAAVVLAPAISADPQRITVIRLTQVACQFLEPENGIDRGFQATQKSECEAVNERTADWRLAAAKVMKLPPGEYVFRVTNKDVPYELGFWIRSAGYDPDNPLHKLSKTSVLGDGLEAGTTKDYPVTLEPGVYIYSSPLNPTPNYRIVVENEREAHKP